MTKETLYMYIGIAVAVVIIICAIAGLLFIYFKKRTKKEWALNINGDPQKYTFLKKGKGYNLYSNDAKGSSVYYVKSGKVYRKETGTLKLEEVSCVYFDWEKIIKTDKSK